MEEKKEKEVSNKEKSGDTKNTKPLNIKFIIALVAITSFFVLYSGTNTNGGFLSNLFKSKDTSGVQISNEEVKKIIDENLLSNGLTSEVTEITEESGLYKVKLIVSGQEYESYITKDEKIFFIEGINLEEIKKEKENSETAAQQQIEEQKANLPKNEKPQVELFVMSHCPYGTQIEKGILPVVNALENKIDFDIKFCDYAMHGETELQEELQQYCISQNEPEKYISYLECFLAEGDSEGCLETTNINQTKLKSCISSTDTKYKVTAGFEDESTWKGGTYPSFSIFQEDVDKYGVSGSPTLIINETQVSTSRDSQSLLEMICAGFENTPEECNITLSSETPSAGFGYDATGSDSNASCG